MPLKIIDNFTGRLTRNIVGDMNNGEAKYLETFGNDPFSNPERLTWLEQPIQIDPNGTVVTDLIVAAKPRLESGITYVYAVGHTGRVYKIQVNQPSGYNPNLDNPVLLTTITMGSPTFKLGTSIQFYPVSFSPATVEGMYIFWDNGVTSINFDGTGERYISLIGGNYSYTARPSVQFNGKMYWGDGNNVAIIDSTLSISSLQIVPSLPYNVFVRDMSVSVDGNYIEIIASETPPQDITTANQDTTSLSPGNSYKILWNGTPLTGITSYNTYNSYSINSNIAFGSYSYTMGYDMGGGAIYSGTSKIISLPNGITPNINAKFSSGNMLGLASPESNHVQLHTNILMYGQFDQDVPKGLYRLLRWNAQGNDTDVIQVPVCLNVSNLFYGPSYSGYPVLQIGSAKMYFSTLENNPTGLVKYKLYKFNTVPTGQGTAIQGVYETQQETSLKLFRSIVSRKFKPTEIRFYTEPLVVGNSLQIDIIGSSGNPIPGCTEVFTVGTNVVVGEDVMKFTPQSAPTASMGIRITNLGTVNWVGLKLEVEYEPFGTQ